MLNRVTIPLSMVLVLFASVHARAGDVEFILSRQDANHDSVADEFFADIEVYVPGATQVRMFDGTDWTDFQDGGGGGDFWIDTDDFATMTALLGEISGSYTLEITVDGNASTYDFTLGGSAATIGAAMPSSIPEITGLGWAGNTATLSWDWPGGDANTVDELDVWADTMTGGTWQYVYDKASDDPPPNYIPKTTLQVDDIVFPAAPGSYDEIEFAVEYANITDVDGANGQVVSGWTLTGGDELFGAPDGEVIELLVSSDTLTIPEPATLGLLGLGALALVRKKRR